MNKENKPRIFSNSISLKEKESNFIKSSLQHVITEKMTSASMGIKSSKMKHDNVKKQFIMIMQ